MHDRGDCRCIGRHRHRWIPTEGPVKASKVDAQELRVEIVLDASGTTWCHPIKISLLSYRNPAPQPPHHDSAFTPGPGGNGHRIPALPCAPCGRIRGDLGSRAPAISADAPTCMAPCSVANALRGFDCFTACCTLQSSPSLTAHQPFHVSLSPVPYLSNLATGPHPLHWTHVTHATHLHSFSAVFKLTRAHPDLARRFDPGYTGFNDANGTADAAGIRKEDNSRETGQTLTVATPMPM